MNHMLRQNPTVRLVPTGPLPTPPRADGSPVVPDLPDIPDQIAVKVYQRTLARRWTTPHRLASDLDIPAARARQALETLGRLRLVRYCERREQFTAVSPEAAQAELAMPLEQAIHERRRELAGLHRRLHPFADAFTATRRSHQRQDAVVVCHDPEQIRTRMADALRTCRTEILCTQPVCGAREPAPYLRPHLREVLGRGVTMRVVYPHTARTNANARAYLREVAAAGAEVRTSNDVFDHLLVIDGEVAFVREDGADGADEDLSSVVVVYDPSVVRVFRRMHRHAWQSGSEYVPEDDRPCTGTYGETYDELKATILGLLATGLKDDVVARRVGMSSRTFRRHIAGIMAELHARSRFQAGVAAARAGLVG